MSVHEAASAPPMPAFRDMMTGNVAIAGVGRRRRGRRSVTSSSSWVQRDLCSAVNISLSSGSGSLIWELTSASCYVSAHSLLDETNDSR